MEKIKDRVKQPSLELIDKLEIENYTMLDLDNGVPVYYVGGVEEDVIRIEIVFNAGRWFETQPAISRTVSQQMKKGTSSKTSQQIADAIEFYGAQFEINNGHDYTSVILFCLKKYVNSILPVIVEIINDAVFPQEELELFIRRQKQKLKINEKNTDFHANRKFNSVLFGETHPYGYSLTEEHLGNLRRESLLDFHRKHYVISLCKIFISGNINDDVISVVNKNFGAYHKNGFAAPENNFIIHTANESLFKIIKEDSVQSSIRIGNITIPKNHPDYPQLNILTVVFGGYFGSRLMSNIREDKGYTYGIHAGNTHFLHGNYFSVDTEAGNEVCLLTVNEIYKEMDILRNELITEEELTIVRNYMMGNILRATDGPFNRINVIKSLVMSGLDLNYFDKLVKAIKTVTPGELISMANKYLAKENMKEVICGNVN